MMEIELKLPVELIDVALQVINDDVDSTYTIIDKDDLKNDHLLAYYHKRAMLYWALRNAKSNAELTVSAAP